MSAGRKEQNNMVFRFNVLSPLEVHSTNKTSQFYTLYPA
jgi:hypothetical protein